MSWADRVRLYYSSAYMTGVAAIYYVLLTLFTGVKFNLQVAVISIAVQILINFLQKKTSRNYIYIGLPILLAFIVELLLQPAGIAVVNTIFILILNAIFIKNYGSTIDYRSYKYYLTNLSVGLGIALAFYIITTVNVNKVQIFRILAIYFFLVVIALREAIGYFCNIRRTKASIRFNFGLFIILMVMCSNFFFDLLSRGINFVLDIISLIAGKIAEVLVGPAGMLFNMLYEFTSKRAPDFETENLMKQKMQEDSNRLIKQNQVNDESYKILQYIVVAVLVALLIYVFYMVIKKVKHNMIKKDNWESYEEVVEDLAKPSKKYKEKRGFAFLNLRGKSYKDKIVIQYNRLVGIYKKKNIFKKYMTPTQFSNNMKLHLDKKLDLDSTTNIYNEARFSNHDMKADDAKIVGDTVKDIIKKTGK